MRKQKQKRVSIKDVANTANVSVATVSNVINNNINVNSSTAVKVRKAISRLGYVPQERKGRKNKLHVLTRNSLRSGYLQIGLYSESVVLDEISKGVIAGLSGHEANVVIIGGYGDDFNPDSLMNRKLDGLVVIAEAPKLAVSQARSIPTVRVAGMNVEGEDYCDTILYDNQKVSELAANYLIRNGHKRICYFGPPRQRLVTTQREEAFFSCIDNYKDIELVKMRISPSVGDNDHEDMKAMLIKHNPTGFFCYDDKIALAVYVLALKCGLKYGKDYEIISCNNWRHYLDYISPDVPSVDIHMEELGAQAALQLVSRISAPEKPLMQKIITPVLVDPKKSNKQTQ